MTSEASETPSPRSSALMVLTPAVLQEALLKKEGPAAKFKSFEVKDFCSKGDNYACYVTSVAVKYVSGNEEKCASIVAKLNQWGGMENTDDFAARVFEKEGRFHCELVPALNELRKTVHLPPLKYPSCFYASFDAGQKCLLLEDMRDKSFRMVDPFVQLDTDHVLLVMEELAQLHASALLLEEQMNTEKFLATFNFMDNVFSSEVMMSMFRKTFSGYVQNGIRAAEKLGGHEELVGKLNKMIPECYEIINAAIETCEPKFQVVNHGDCWKNNMLFRYENGKVADVCLLDLQINRYASLALDLNLLLFTSVGSDTRNAGLMNFLSTYYNAFKKVFDVVKKPMKFTLNELYEEYRRKNTYGAMMGFMSFAILGLKTEDKPDLSNLKDENISAGIDQNQMHLFAALDANPTLRSEVEGLLKEIEEHNIF